MALKKKVNVINCEDKKLSDSSKNSNKYILEKQVGHLLRRAHQRHTWIFQKRIGDRSLTPVQFAALVKLNVLGEVSQNQLGRNTAMDASTMQGVIKRLASRGLIERKADPNDRRRLLLSLSEEGKKVLELAIPSGRIITNSTLSPLSDDEQKTLIALLKKISY